MLYIKSKGISLLELMVVIAVMGILSAGTIFIVQNQTTNAYVVDGLGNMDQLESAVRQFNAIYGCLPGDCAASQLPGLPYGITVNSGNGDGIVNNWYTNASATPAGMAGFEDVNGLQQLIATGLLTNLPKGLIANQVPTGLQDTIRTDYILSTGGALYGLPQIAYTYNALTLFGGNNNSLYTLYDQYYIHGKSPNIFYDIRSIHSLLLPFMNGIPNVASQKITNIGTQVDFIISVIATFINSAPGTAGIISAIDQTSLQVMAGIDKKVDGDTPISGTHQAILTGAIAGASNPGLWNDFVIMPVQYNAATNALPSAPTPATNVATPLKNITYISATGTSGFTLNSSIISWSNIPVSSFQKSPVIAATPNTVNTINNVAGVDLVRPIYGLN